MRDNRTGGGSRWAALGDQAQRRDSSSCITGCFAQPHKPRLLHRLPAPVLLLVIPATLLATRSFSENASAATQPMRYHFGLLLEHSRRR